MNEKFLVLSPIQSAALPVLMTQTLHSVFPQAQIANKAIPEILDSDFRDDLKRRGPSLLLLTCDDQISPRLGSIIKGLHSIEPEMPVIVVHPEFSEDIRTNTLALGASDSFSSTEDQEEIRRMILLHLKKSQDRRKATAPTFDWQKRSGIVGSSPSFRAILERIPVAARYPAPVLITGESGTGKELVARAIHYLSARSGGPFFPVQCGAVAGNLFENELFGHEAGAYTDAHGARKGVVSEAEKGTLFLDEIDTLEPQLQAKLLRLIEEHEYRPVGSSKILKADIRIMTATNADLSDLIKKKHFRADLFYRITGFTFELPPLRKRRDDIPSLANHFLKVFAAEDSRPISTLSDSAVRRLLSYEWPGNVRELAHVIQRSVIFSKDREIGKGDIELPKDARLNEILPYKTAMTRALKIFDTDYITDALNRSNWNITQAARMADLDRSTFWRKMCANGIARPKLAETDI